MAGDSTCLGSCGTQNVSSTGERRLKEKALLPQVKAAITEPPERMGAVESEAEDGDAVTTRTRLLKEQQTLGAGGLLVEADQISVS